MPTCQQSAHKKPWNRMVSVYMAGFFHWFGLGLLCIFLGVVWFLNTF